MANDSSFYRTSLNGNRIPVSFDEIHKIRKDILLYFDENVGEKVSVFLADARYQQLYWQFLSIDFEREWAESRPYKTLVEEGCLALLNGIALELLDEPIGLITKTWRDVNTETILSYIYQYQPQSTRLKTAKAHLVRTYEFIYRLTYADIEDGFLRNFSCLQAGEWFDKEIVQNYYENQAKGYLSS